MKDIQTTLEDTLRAVKIECGTAEKERLVEELAAFEKWLEPLLAVDTTGTEPLLFSHQAVNVLSEDIPGDAEPAKLQQAASNFADGFYRVPSIIE